MSGAMGRCKGPLVRGATPLLFAVGQQGCGQVLQRLPCFLHSICHWRHKGISYHHQQLLRGNPEAPKIDVLERVRGSQSQGRAPQQGKREAIQGK
uniref:Uncharacterized protein n=1 Tax=Oryza meridionalis TaxID=40149 RepID=A0A0E0CIW1_9ORYZ